MRREDLSILAAFEVVARERSFTRAASRLGVSTSALSHAIRGFEERTGIRLLARSTRSVSTTEAGERLLKTLQPALQGIEAELAALSAMRDKPAGTVRITAVKHAYTAILQPLLRWFVPTYPDIQVEVEIDDGFTDIIAKRLDAGIRFGGQVAKDMVAVRIGPDMRAAVVGSPLYFKDHPPPHGPHDLANHRCINYRLATAGGLYRWRFAMKGRPLEVSVNGPLVFNNGDLILASALDGHGLAYLFDDQVREPLADGRLVRVLEDWCAPFPGYHLYYPDRRQTPPAFATFVEALRRGPSKL